jgi:hypothetical protein
MTQAVVVFSHGKDSGPWGHKIKALAATVRALGHRAESVDYQGIDSVEQRVANNLLWQRAARLYCSAAGTQRRP